MMAEVTLQGTPNCQGSPELALANKCAGMDIHTAWGKAFRGWLLLPLLWQNCSRIRRGCEQLCQVATLLPAPPSLNEI